MSHRICFRDVDMGWHNALPVGNGRTGAMAWYEKGTLHIALNHYDSYYEGAPFDDPARHVKSFEELKRLTDDRRSRPGYEKSHYLTTLNPEQGHVRPVYGESSYPQAGEILLKISNKVDQGKSLLELSIEEGMIRFEAGDAECQVKAQLFTACHTDGVVLKLAQTEEGLWEMPSLWRQDGRGQAAYRYENREETDRKIMLCRFSQGAAENKDSPAAAKECVQETVVYAPVRKGKEYFVTAAVRPGEGRAQETALRLWKNAASAEQEHRQYWRGFWKSTVEMPDPYLETLWHLYVYLLGCCSGEGSVHSDQACGLSGLWDIRRPCMWGSMWYWDVNIQTAFYGTFASNHLEQARVFCDAFLSYGEEARRFARAVYGKDGWALDYPHPLYHCIQPWCALFLWQYYRYTMDEGFLSEKAYPVFREILAFYREIARVDAQGVWHLDYDICPEQGPVERDSVITMAAIRQLACNARTAAVILKRPEKEIREYQDILEGIPAYAVTADKRRWKDSTLVQDDVFLRHPSVLMPVFPAEEVHMESPEGLRELAENTIRYAAENTEAGTFGFVWIAAAAARMGAGESAVRILYEKGLDLVTHTNGLGYEESERFINYCHLTKPANYLPVMCEEAGGVTAVVNLLFLQEVDGVLRVFPAIPDGNDRFSQPASQYETQAEELKNTYGSWKACGFQGLRAPGGFEVSAQLRDSRVTWLKILCHAEGELRLAVPKAAGMWSAFLQWAEKSGTGCVKDDIYRKDMRSGEKLEFGTKEETHCTGNLPEGKETVPGEAGVLMRQAALTRRRVFLGENTNTAFYKAVDSMVCPYGYAEGWRYPMTPYIFDFTEEKNKDYENVYRRQIIRAGRACLYAGGPRAVGTEEYCADRGYGFLTEAGMGPETITICGRKGPDDLRRDFAEGELPVVFGVELPAGKYDILVISGDQDEESLTNLEILDHGIHICGGRKGPGRYQCRILPVMHEADGVLRLRLSTEKGRKWKLNGLFINKEYMLL